MNDIFRRCAAFAFWIASLAALAGCGGFESTGAGPAAETPAYRVGDRWVYNGRDGFRVLTTWEETHTISTVGADGISERITVKGPTLDLARTERMIAPGRITVGALYENETPFDPHYLDLQNETVRADFRKLWPVGKMPVLRDEARNCTVPEATIATPSIDGPPGWIARFSFSSS